MQNPFNLPFPAREFNLDTTIITQRSEAWVQNMGLLASFPQVYHYKLLLIGELVTRTHPSFALDRLQLIADWSIWLFINDDLFDHLSYDTLYDRTQLYLDILHGHDVAVDETPFARGLADLWQRTQLFVGDAWKARFVENMEAHLVSLLWEFQTKADNDVPDVATYLQMRAKTSGFDAYIDLLDISDSFALPVAVQSSPPVKRLTKMVNNIASWANEILSIHKEIAQGDHLLNLVWLYHYNERISLSEAIKVVVDLCQAEIDMFMAQVNHLPTFSADVNVNLHQYTSLLQDVIRGTLDWHFVTDRYRQHWQQN